MEKSQNSDKNLCFVGRRRIRRRYDDANRTNLVPE